MRYTWIPFYKELAEKVMNYRNDRASLLSLIGYRPIIGTSEAGCPPPVKQLRPGRRYFSGRGAGLLCEV